MGNPLATFLTSLVGGGQQQAPQAQAPAPSAQQGGLAGLLSNPLTQGALAAYFGGVGARKGDWGEAISRGGLSGLSAFDNARQNQLKIPLQQAQIANLQGHGKLETAQTGLAQARTDQLGGIAEANKNTAMQILAMKPHMTSEQQQRADLLAGTIMNDTSKVYDPKEVVTSLFSEPLTEQKTQAEIDNAKASAGRSTAETAAIPKKLAMEEGKAADDAKYHTGELAARNRAIDKPTKTASKDDDNYQKAYQAAYKEAAANYIKTNTHMWGGPKADEVDAYASKAAQAQADRLFPKGAKGAATAPAATLPDGWKAGPVDASGRPTAIDDKGVSHTYVD